MGRLSHPYDEPWHDLDPPDRVATPSEAVAEWAANVGGDSPDRAWLLHDRDVWVANPAYRGPPQPHPEDAMYLDPSDPDLYPED